jgi:hypothetical protein
MENLAMNEQTDDQNDKKDKKEILKEKRELKKLEMFMYDRTSSLRQTTRKIAEQGNYYTDLIKGTPKISSLNSSFNRDIKTTGKKRGRKPKKHIEIIQNNEQSNQQKKKRGRKKTVNITNNITNNIMNITNISNPGNELQDDEEEKEVLELVEDDMVNGSISSSNKKSKTQLSQNYSNNLDTSKNNKNQLLMKAATFKVEDEDLLIDDIPKDFNLDGVNRDFPHELEMYKKQKTEINTNINLLKTDTFINCDLRFLNFEMITSRIGFFDVIMIDPPWRIKGGQRNDTSFMFSNSKFNLEYNTLSNNQIISLPVEKLSKKGNY